MQIPVNLLKGAAERSCRHALSVCDCKGAAGGKTTWPAALERQVLIAMLQCIVFYQLKEVGFQEQAAG